MNTAGVHFSFLLYQSYLAGRNDLELVRSSRDTTIESTMHELAYALGEMDRVKYAMGDVSSLKKRTELLHDVREYLELDSEDMVPGGKL